MNPIEYQRAIMNCDNPQCGYTEQVEDINLLKSYINKPCPKCGQVMFTQECFDKSEEVMKLLEILNPLFPFLPQEDISEGVPQQQTMKINVIFKEGKLQSLEIKNDDTDWRTGLSTDWVMLVEKWLDYKKTKKQTYTSNDSILNFVSHLETISERNIITAKELVNMSIFYNWAGVFPQRNFQKKQSTTIQKPIPNSQIFETKKKLDETQRKVNFYLEVQKIESQISIEQKIEWVIDAHEILSIKN